MMDFPSSPAPGTLVVSGRKKWISVGFPPNHYWDLASTPDQAATDAQAALASVQQALSNIDGGVPDSAYGGGLPTFDGGTP